MKKVLFLFATMAMAMMASAQVTYIYIPGDGEHRFGFNFSANMGKEMLYVGQSANGSYYSNATVTDSISNGLSYFAGITWGYETDWRSRKVQNFVVTDIEVGLLPFSSEVRLLDGQMHKLNCNMIQASIGGRTGMVFEASDELTFSFGLGASFMSTITNKVKLDGQSLTVASSDDGFGLFSSSWHMPINVNAGFKFWPSDNFYVGAYVQYAFWDFFSLMNSLFDETSENLVYINGESARVNANLGYKPFKLAAQIGFAW